MANRFEITWIVENGCGHYRVKDHLTGKVVHCDKGELNETMYELMGCDM